MNVTPAENWELAQWIVVPADTTMRFTQNEAQLTVRRTKLVEGWYNGSPRETVVQRIGKARADCSAVTVNGHEACAARSREQGFRMRWLLGKRTVRHDLLWHCPDLAAVYHMEYDGPAERAAVMEQFAVACCTRNDA